MPRRLALALVFLAAAPALADMAADSPVKFPKDGPLPALFPLDRPAKKFEEPEKGYAIFDAVQRSLKQIDAIRAKMPAGKFTAPKFDGTHLVRTRKVLTQGGDLKILAVGDSIVADTMRSAWVAELQKSYPKAKIQAEVYVRGGGGCQHYKEEGRVKKHIAPRKPDLILIGGISQQDAASVREVIKQIRAELPEAESLLFSGTFGTTDPRVAKEIDAAPHSGTGAWGQALSELAAAEKCAYLDMTTPWAEYLRSAKVHPHRFYRDVVHANEYGEQVLAKILAAYWAGAAE